MKNDRLPIERLVRISREQSRRIDAYRVAAYSAEQDIPSTSVAIRALLDLGLDAAAAKNAGQP